ncbi:hypothetical protein F4604DRAFT_1938893 [Suillus subluteus]|nr:hypothetical protein F4604DRAFT_1938893 [Suillus subluteus]
MPVSIAQCLASVTLTTGMPKCTLKLRAAMENLGGWAKKRKISADADKENKVRIKLNWSDSQSDHAALWMLTTKASAEVKLLGQRRNIVGIAVLPSSILAELDAEKIM